MKMYQQEQEANSKEQGTATETEDGAKTEDAVEGEVVDDEGDESKDA